MACVCRAVLQTGGATPLFIASQNGHVECVRALLGGGAAIDQAMVSCARSMAWHCGGCMRGDATKTYAAGRELALRAVEGLGQELVQPSVSLDGVGSILMIACGTRATEVVRPGMMCGLCAVRCCR